MKKLLILILIALLLALTIIVVINGVGIGSFEILGIKGIQNESAALDEKIQQSAKLAETDFKKAVSDVEENAKKLEQEKKEYEDMTAISSEGDVRNAAQIEKYEIETLWVKLGNHATSEGAVIRMDVLKGDNSAQGTYNLKFTVNGSYISITDFVSDIENDDTLGFKIEEFKLVPASSGGELQATFVCKDIAIVDVTETSTQTPDTQDTSNTNSANTSNTNSTNTTNTNTSNSTNTTNTSNTAR